MKKVLIFLLLWCNLGFGQNWNNATFNLQNVSACIRGSSPNLSSIFANAVSGRFDATYNQDSYAPANSLLRFRNYHDPSGYTIYYNLIKQPSAQHDPGFTLTVGGTVVVDVHGAVSGSYFVANGLSVSINSFIYGFPYYDAKDECALVMRQYSVAPSWNTNRLGTHDNSYGFGSGMDSGTGDVDVTIYMSWY